MGGHTARSPKPTTPSLLQIKTEFLLENRDAWILFLIKTGVCLLYWRRSRHFRDWLGAEPRRRGPTRGAGQGLPAGLWDWDADPWRPLPVATPTTAAMVCCRPDNAPPPLLFHVTSVNRWSEGWPILMLKKLTLLANAGKPFGRQFTREARGSINHKGVSWLVTASNFFRVPPAKVPYTQ